MKTVAFKMSLKPNCQAEYKRRHDEIWPELEKLLKEAGISDYHIFLDEETLSLFAFQKLSKDSNEDQLSNHSIMKSWWDYMSDLMEVNVDNSPKSVHLKEVFYMK